LEVQVLKGVYKYFHKKSTGNFRRLEFSKSGTHYLSEPVREV